MKITRRVLLSYREQNLNKKASCCHYSFRVNINSGQQIYSLKYFIGVEMKRIIKLHKSLKSRVYFIIISLCIDAQPLPFKA